MSQPGQPTRRLAPGDPLNIETAANRNWVYDSINRLLKDIRSLKDVRQDINPDVWPIKNSSGSDLTAPFGILGLNDVVFDDSDNLEAFNRKAVFIGATPTASHKGKFGIVRSPLKNGKSGEVVISGTERCTVNVTDTSHGYADVEVGNRTRLTSGRSGAVQIVYPLSFSETGDHECLVRFDGAGGVAASPTGSGACGCTVVRGVVTPTSSEYFGTKLLAYRWQLTGISDWLESLGCDVSDLVMVYDAGSSPQSWHVEFDRTCGSSIDEYTLILEETSATLTARIELTGGYGTNNCDTEIRVAFRTSAVTIPQWNRTQSMLLYGVSTYDSTDGDYEDPPANCVFCLEPVSLTCELDCTPDSLTFNLPRTGVLKFTGTYSSANNEIGGSPVAYIEAADGIGNPRYFAEGDLDAAFASLLSGLGDTPLLTDATDCDTVPYWEFLDVPSGSFDVTHYSNTGLTADPKTTSVSWSSSSFVRLVVTAACVTSLSGIDAKVSLGQGFKLALAGSYNLNGTGSGGLYMSAFVDVYSNSLEPIYVGSDESTWTWDEMEIIIGSNYFGVQSVGCHFYGA